LNPFNRGSYRLTPSVGQTTSWGICKEIPPPHPLYDPRSGIFCGFFVFCVAIYDSPPYMTFQGSGNPRGGSFKTGVHRSTSGKQDPLNYLHSNLSEGYKFPVGAGVVVKKWGKPVENAEVCQQPPPLAKTSREDDNAVRNSLCMSTSNHPQKNKIALNQRPGGREGGRVGCSGDRNGKRRSRLAVTSTTPGENRGGPKSIPSPGHQEKEDDIQRGHF